jgi:NAD(P)-dependent dehydrogenase (short-subunit alcohol dehydrogenase family)
MSGPPADTAALMLGRVCLVTGAASGIGRATALALARLGATMIVVSRDRNRGEELLGVLRDASGVPGDLVVADLSSQASIARMTDEVRSRHARLHVLINNAGGIFTERRLSADGIEATLALNHLAYSLVTRRLVDLLIAGAPARIVNVTSDAHRAFALDFDDLQGARRYRGVRAYSQSKLANVLFTFELARRLAGTGVTANCVHPGAVDTGIWRDSRGLLRALVTLLRPLMRAPARGAAPVVRLASDPDLESVSGRYYLKLKEGRTSRRARDEEAAARLWRISAGLAPVPSERGPLA